MKTFFLIVSLLACTGVIYVYYREKRLYYVDYAYTVSVLALAVSNVAMAVGVLTRNELVRGIAYRGWLVALGATGAAFFIYMYKKKHPTFIRINSDEDREMMSNLLEQMARARE